MLTPGCDHYWLVRRGGTCPDCGQKFAGQFQNLSPGAAEILNAKTPAELVSALQAVRKVKP